MTLLLRERAIYDPSEQRSWHQANRLGTQSLETNSADECTKYFPLASAVSFGHGELPELLGSPDFEKFVHVETRTDDRILIGNRDLDLGGHSRSDLPKKG